MPARRPCRLFAPLCPRLRDGASVTARPPLSALWFVVPLAGIYAGAALVLAVLPAVSDPSRLAAALTIDLVLLVPVLYYVVLVRGRGWSGLTLAPVAVLSYLAASWMIPSEHHALLDLLAVALPALELAIAAALGYKAWGVLRAREAPQATDVYDRLRDIAGRTALAPAVARALAYEVSIVHYAFARTAPEPAARHVAYHRRGGYGAIVAALLMAAAIELVGVHFLLRSWSETAVWLHAALSLYGILWIVGDYRAMRHRPHEVDASGLRLRLGVRWDLEVTWEAVASIRRTRQLAEGDGVLRAVPIGLPQYVVTLRRPVEATGPYGISRTVRTVGFAVDDPDAFEARLKAAGQTLNP